MFNQFNPQTNHQPAVELIPAGTLAFAVLTVQGLAKSGNTGGEYAKLELTIDRGPYERRKLFPMIGNPTDERNNEKYRQKSLGDLQHMLEAAGLFKPDQPETYQRFANASFVDILQALEGRTIAIKIKIEKGTDGYADKNVVADFLSPNPVSRTFKSWQQLNEGGAGQAQQQGAAAQQFGGQAGGVVAGGVVAGKPNWL